MDKMDKQIDRQVDGKIDRWTNRQIGRQVERQIRRQIRLDSVGLDSIRFRLDWIIYDLNYIELDQIRFRFDLIRFSFDWNRLDQINRQTRLCVRTCFCTHICTCMYSNTQCCQAKVSTMPKQPKGQLNQIRSLACAVLGMVQTHLPWRSPPGHMVPLIWGFLVRSGHSWALGAALLFKIAT